MYTKPNLQIVHLSEADKSPSKLKKWRDSFLHDKKASVKPKTLVKYKTAIDPYIEHVGEHYWVPTRFDVIDYLHAVRERTSAMTAFIYWSVLRTWFNYIEVAGGFGEFPNPATQIRDMKLTPIEPKPEPKGISERHIKQLFQMLDNLPDAITNLRDKTLLLFIWRTGARSGEASGLCRKQLHLDEHYAVLSAEETKSKKERKLVFGNTVKIALENWLKYLDDIGCNSEFVFPSVGHAGRSNPKPYPITVSGTRSMFRRRCNQAGIPEYTVHEFRHTFTKDAIKAKKNPDSIRRQLGHRDIRMVMYYAKVFDEGQMDDFRAFGD